MGPLGHGPAEPLVIRDVGLPLSWPLGRLGSIFVSAQLASLYTVILAAKEADVSLVLALSACSAAGFPSCARRICWLGGGRWLLWGGPETDRPSDVHGTVPAPSHCGGRGVVSVAHISLHASVSPVIERGSPASVVAAVSTWSSKESIVQAHRELMKAARPRALDPGEHMPSPPPPPRPHTGGEGLRIFLDAMVSFFEIICLYWYHSYLPRLLRLVEQRLGGIKSSVVIHARSLLRTFEGTRIVCAVTEDVTGPGTDCVRGRGQPPGLRWVGLRRHQD